MLKDTIVSPSTDGSLPCTPGQITFLLKEATTPSSKLAGKSFFLSGRFSGGIKGSELSNIIKQNGGTLGKNLQSSTYVITSFSGAKKLWNAKFNGLLYSLRLILALIWKNTEVIDFDKFEITKSKLQRYNVISCDHFLNFSHNGQGGIPPSLSACYNKLHSLYLSLSKQTDEEKRREEAKTTADSRFRLLLKHFQLVSIDIMHHIGSLVRKMIKALTGLGYLNLESLQGGEGLDRNLSQFKTSDLRDLVAGHSKTLLNHLTEKGKGQFSLIDHCFSVFAEINFLVYQKSITVSKDPFIQARLHALCFAYKETLQALFGAEGMLEYKFLGLPLHYVSAHFGDEFEKSPLLFLSTDKPEGVFKLLNQATSNCHKGDVLRRWLHEIFDLHMVNQLKPPSASGTGRKYLYSFRETKEWGDFEIDLTKQSEELLKKLSQKLQFGDNEQWCVDREKNKIIFLLPKESIQKLKEKPHK